MIQSIQILNVLEQRSATITVSIFNRLILAETLSLLSSVLNDILNFDMYDLYTTIKLFFYITPALCESDNLIGIRLYYADQPGMTERVPSTTTSMEHTTTPKPTVISTTATTTNTTSKPTTTTTSMKQPIEESTRRGRLNTSYSLILLLV